jgi:hypothetical protein
MCHMCSKILFFSRDCLYLLASLVVIVSFVDRARPRVSFEPLSFLFGDG